MSAWWKRRSALGKIALIAGVLGVICAGASVAIEALEYALVTSYEPPSSILTETTTGWHDRSLLLGVLSVPTFLIAIVCGLVVAIREQGRVRHGKPSDADRLR
jgi:hypothetical protein